LAQVASDEDAKQMPNAATSAPGKPKSASGAFMRLRHWMLVFSFLLLVALPTGLTGYYLYAFAADQYASKVGFAVRNEDSASAFDLFGSLSNLSGSSSSDTDILYRFIQGQELVVMIDDQIDLREMYTKPQQDWVFSLTADASIEDLLDYWAHAVRIVYDPGTGLIEIEARAFDPEDARNIVQAIFDQSSARINNLSDIARADLTRYAREELDQAIERLKDARRAIAIFRNENQLVDPSADIQGQMGLLNSLQAQLADTLIELDLLSETARENDPRITAARLRSEAIQNRISIERRNLGVADGSERAAFADLVGQFESLQVDLRFGEEAYIASLTAFDGSVAEARRQNKYLAAYLNPTIAQTPQYPQREITLILVALMLFGVWAILVLVYYSLRDRR
jgi:capsular polysaccharide transport system permease protein